MLQAMNTGHDGSLTTIHANTPRDALARLETMAMMGEVRLSEKAVRAQIASAVHMIVQASRMSDGTAAHHSHHGTDRRILRCHQHAGHLPV